MKGFIQDENGIWVSSGTGLSVNYPKSGNQISEVLENSESFWFAHRNNVIREVINSFPSRGNFADIGGGNGYQILVLKKQASERNYFLIEPGYNGCLIASKRGLDGIYNCGFSEFDFEEAQVGGLGLFDVLEHISDDAKFLNALYDVMQPNSSLYITVPTYQFLWNDVDIHGEHQRRYTKESMYSLVKNTKFSISYFSYFFSYLVVPTYLFRTLPYKIFGRGTNEEIVKKELSSHTPGSILTKFFDLFNAREIKKIKNRDSIAYGASCVVVLKK